MGKSSKHRANLIASLALIVAPTGLTGPALAGGNGMQVSCSVSHQSERLNSRFVQQFCGEFQAHFENNTQPSQRPEKISLRLTDVGEFALNVDLQIVFVGGSTANKSLNLSVRDSILRPSISKTLVFSAVKMIEEY